MTIKEIEELSGMTRANIRFYEKEGLIKPQRDSNGYRNYSRDDLNILNASGFCGHSISVWKISSR